jgi:hypothetical protein
VVNAKPRPLYPQERDTRLGGLRAGVDRYGNSRPHRNSIPEPSSPQPVAIPTTLTWEFLLLRSLDNNNATVADCMPKDRVDSRQSWGLTPPVWTGTGTQSSSYLFPGFKRPQNAVQHSPTASVVVNEECVKPNLRSHYTFIASRLNIHHNERKCHVTQHAYKKLHTHKYATNISLMKPWCE